MYIPPHYGTLNSTTDLRSLCVCVCVCVCRSDTILLYKEITVWLHCRIVLAAHSVDIFSQRIPYNNIIRDNFLSLL